MIKVGKRWYTSDDQNKGWNRKPLIYVACNPLILKIVWKSNSKIILYPYRQTLIKMVQTITVKRNKYNCNPAINCD